MTSMINALNAISPFTWELESGDGNYTILCEGIEVHDPESGSYLSDLDEENCKAWIQKLMEM